MSNKHRGPLDFYPTPAPVTSALVRALGGMIPAKVWEPACGDGAIARVLADAGHEVVATDIADHGFGTAGVDFLATSRPRADAIVTNPPFRLINEFAIHALSLDVSLVAFLAKTRFLEGRKRYTSLWRQHPAWRIYQFTDRLKFYSAESDDPDQPGWNTEAFAWFVWLRDHTSAPAVHWITSKPDSGDALANL